MRLARSSVALFALLALACTTEEAPAPRTHPAETRVEAPPPPSSAPPPTEAPAPPPVTGLGVAPDANGDIHLGCTVVTAAEVQARADRRMPFETPPTLDEARMGLVRVAIAARRAESFGLATSDHLTDLQVTAVAARNHVTPAELVAAAAANGIDEATYRRELAERFLGVQVGTMLAGGIEGTPTEDQIEAEVAARRLTDPSVSPTAVALDMMNARVDAAFAREAAAWAAVRTHGQGADCVEEP